MGLVSKVFRRSPNPNECLGAIESADYKIGDLDKDTCENCSTHYPSSLKIETDTPLFNSAPETHAQILVATGQDNWIHDIADEPTPWGKVCKVLSHASDDLAKLAGGKIRVNGTNHEEDDLPPGKVLVTVLPQFLKVVTDPEHAVDHVKALLQVEPDGPFPSFAIPITDAGYILLCSHRTRDKRCGITAPLMKRELDIELRKQDLYREPLDDTAGGIRVWFTNHVGGHKFAANVLVYTTNGTSVMLARMRPEHAKSIVQGTIEQGVLYPDHVRSCARLKSYEW